MTDVEKKRKAIIGVAYWAMIIAIGLFAVRYAMGVCMPFVLAFLFAAVLQKPKRFLVKKTPLKSGLASALCVFVFIFVVLALIALIGVRIVNEIKGFIDYIALRFQNIDSLVDNVEAWLLNICASFPDFLRNTLTENIAELFEQLRDFIAGKDSEVASQITSSIGGSFSLSWIKAPISGIISTASQLPSVLIAVVITIVASCFMTNEFDSITEFIKCQFPEHRRKDLSRAKAILKDSLGKMAKAYALIMCVTFIEMSVGLTVLRLIGVFESNYIVIIALITAIVDIVPVLGTGTVVIPWALYSLITGNFGMAIGLIVIYAVISVLRQIIEPKLVAGQLGLSPIVSIAAIYFGLKIFGVLGVIVMPILVVMIKLLNDEGIIRIWKSPSKEKAKKAVQEEAAQQEKSEESGEE